MSSYTRRNNSSYEDSNLKTKHFPDSRGRKITKSCSSKYYQRENLSPVEFSMSFARSRCQSTSYKCSKLSMQDSSFEDDSRLKLNSFINHKNAARSKQMKFDIDYHRSSRGHNTFPIENSKVPSRRYSTSRPHNYKSRNSSWEEDIRPKIESKIRAPTEVKHTKKYERQVSRNYDDDSSKDSSYEEDSKSASIRYSGKRKVFSGQNLKSNKSEKIPKSKKFKRDENNWSKSCKEKMSKSKSAEWQNELKRSKGRNRRSESDTRSLYSENQHLDSDEDSKFIRKSYKNKTRSSSSSSSDDSLVSEKDSSSSSNGEIDSALADLVSWLKWEAHRKYKGEILELTEKAIDEAVKCLQDRIQGDVRGLMERLLPLNQEETENFFFKRMREDVDAPWHLVKELSKKMAWFVNSKLNTIRIREKEKSPEPIVHKTREKRKRSSRFAQELWQKKRPIPDHKSEDEVTFLKEIVRPQVPSRNVTRYAQMTRANLRIHEEHSYYDPSPKLHRYPNQQRPPKPLQQQQHHNGFVSNSHPSADSQIQRSYSPWSRLLASFP